MSDDGGVAALLADRPEFESALSALLAVDDDNETWEFDDVPLDSGTFGELVSRDVVEKTGEGYRLADPQAVRAALDGEPTSTTSNREAAGPDGSLSLPTVAFDGRVVAAVVALITLVVVFRAFTFGAIFRDGHVILAGNDAWFYRYHVETFARQAGGPFDIAALSSNSFPLPNGEPLLVATLWFGSALLGGADAVGVVLALYPVISAVLTALLLYLAAVEVTEDRRVGLASVVLFASLPAHAIRTSLGFADHHAFDYPPLALTLVSLVVLVGVVDRSDLRRPRFGAGVLGLGFGVGTQVLAWQAGPLLILPVAAVVVASLLLDVRTGRSPLFTAGPIAAGLALASGLVLGAHVVFGWHTIVVAASPALLFVGTVGVGVLAVAARRLERSAVELAAGYVVGAVAVVGLGALLVPSVLSLFVRRITGQLFRSSAVVETMSLFSANTFGFLLLFGFLLVLALPVLAWAIRPAVEGNRNWLVVATYGWFFLLLAAIQMRFAGEFAVPASLAAGFGFVVLAARVDLTSSPPPFGERIDWRPHVPDARTIGAVLTLLVLVSGLGVVQTPIKVDQVTVDGQQAEAALWMGDYADRRGWSGDDAYVFSFSADSRMYNYFANGYSRTYTFARGNYAAFISATDPAGWYARLTNSPGRWGRTRFVVVSAEFDLGTDTLQNRLLYGNGSRYEGNEALGHYRQVFASSGGDVKVYTLVSGAQISGTAAPNSTVAASTAVDAPGSSFTYEHRTTANATGHYSIRVPYPGEYTVSGNETATVAVSETAVENGTTVRV
jgi:dolichyl-diphosphooligosaccharide--protein glycosyltransferase